MKKRIIFIFLSTSLFINAFGCLNGESKVLKNGAFLYEDHEGNVPYGHKFPDTERLTELVHELDSLYKATNDLDYLSDKGLVLVLLKEYKKAIKIYLKIEKLEPNRYSTASNIGTAYELIGDNKNALKWIKKSVAIDSKSHKESEWIHVKILEAKIQGENSVNAPFLLNTTFGNEIKPETKLTKAELTKLSDALYFQLNERISFVKPNEKIVAELLFELGNIAFLLGNSKDAIADFDLAKDYGFVDQIIDKRIALSKTI
jgi:tetratricopeptide (TPR) repeat protein